MARKSNKQAPAWAVEDNLYSKWGRLYVDMLKAKPFQSLSVPARQFYFVCLANMHDDKARASLQRHIKDTRDPVEAAGNIYYLDIDKYLDYENGFFIMPAKHMEQYGYSRQNGYRLMRELIGAGFVTKIESNKHRKKVNVYKFSDAWKKPVSAAVYKNR